MPVITGPSGGGRRLRIQLNWPQTEGQVTLPVFLITTGSGLVSWWVGWLAHYPAWGRRVTEFAVNRRIDSDFILLDSLLQELAKTHWPY